MGVKNNHTKDAPKTEKSSTKRVSEKVDTRFEKCNLGPKKPPFFFAQKPPGAVKSRKMVGILHVQIHFPAPISTLGVSNTPICPRYVSKDPIKPKKLCILAIGSSNQELAVSWAMWLENPSQGHLFHWQPSTFGGLHPSKLFKRTPQPRAPAQWATARCKKKPKEVFAKMG